MYMWYTKMIFCIANLKEITLRFYTLRSKNILVSKPIKKVIELLSERIFIRCHQSYIVNKNHVSRYNKQGVLIIEPDIKVPVSSRRKDYVIEKIF